MAAVARELSEAIRRADPSLSVEHVGSTSVPGCGGKGIIDLAVLYPEGLLAAARDTLDRLGFQKQGGPEPWPEDRPMRVGAVEHDGHIFRVHAHVITLDCDEHRELIRFRDTLRRDASLRRLYEAQKQSILARGVSDSIEYSKAKGIFVEAALKTAFNRKPMPDADANQQRIAETLKQLGVPEGFLAGYRLPRHEECNDLVSVGLDMFDREQRLERETAAQWHAMVAAAKADGVVLLMISAFRSFDYQRKIIERKLAEGQTLEQITRASALPGYSEHHTGRAIDIGTPGSEPLSEEFEKTPAYAWLTRRANEFGFSLSYPRGNSWGIMFEPWHWRFK